MIECEYLIIGAGIIGLSIANEIKAKNKHSKILVVEKEKDVGFHSSGRNSGVLHAGFYYTSDSLKAQFTRNGNFELKLFCKKHNLRLNENQKIVVAQS